ncbi:MAG: VOC family protein [Clostridia bacterium]|nr:VOC family protein [Clostridia bacterium]
MKLEHIALWTRELEVMREFYVKYFNGKPGPKYTTEHEFSSLFESYFLTFDSGSRLEIMKMADIPGSPTSVMKEQIGLTHIAFSVNHINEVEALTDKLRNDGFSVVKEPHYTGDGYYESCVLDPDGNIVEIVVAPE